MWQAIFTVSLGLLLLLNGTAQAHVVYPCLQEIARAAKLLKECSNVTSTNNHCRKQRQTLSDHVDSCRKQQFTTEQIEKAIKEGESQVEGDSSYHLPEKADLTKQDAIDTSRGNIKNFYHRFSDLTAFPVDAMDQGVNQGGCTQAFLAGIDRYQFMGSLRLSRYARSEADEAPEIYYFYYFSQMVEGVCYPAPSAGQTLENGSRVILNLPGSFFTFLAQAVRQSGASAVIVRCKSEAECFNKQNETQARYSQYQAAYKQLQRLQQCQDFADGNRWYRRMAKLRLSERELPAHCEGVDLKSDISVLQEQVRQNDRLLFDTNPGVSKVQGTLKDSLFSKV